MRQFWLILIGSFLILGTGTSSQSVYSEALPTSSIYLPLIMRVLPPLVQTPLVNLNLVFVSDRNGNAEIYKMRGDGSRQTRLTKNAAEDFGPTWSPDGSRIAFVSNRDGNLELYTMRADGGNLIRLTQTITDEFHPTWSPTGDKLAFYASAPGEVLNDIYTLQTDGTGLTRLTDHTRDGLNHIDPAWSPDGTRIAFVSNTDLYTMQADGSAVLRLTQMPGVGWIGLNQPAWSPDSTQLAFVFIHQVVPADRGHLYIINADGSELQPRDLGINGYPAWSPDGSRLAFTTPQYSIANVKAEIGVMNVDGSQVIMLTTQNQGNNYQPAWAP